MIPIYRAKKIDSDEYVEGLLRRKFYENKFFKYFIEVEDLEMNSFNHDYRIDPSTLAIHFPDMIDSEGTKIFASLSEDGKGGTILEYPDDYKSSGVVAYKEMIISANGKECHINHFNFSKCKVTGIQE